jgi:UDP-glucose 4-epimerase
LAEPSRRIVVTGADSPVGQTLLEFLVEQPDVESVRGIVPKHLPGDRNRTKLDVVPFHSDHRAFVDYLTEERPDTVIECGLAPDRTGLVSSKREADVIGTMRLGAAIGSDQGAVRNWILASSSAIYPIASGAPLIADEDSKLHPDLDPFVASIAEAEDYARDLAYRSAHINVSILRLQQLAGPKVEGALASLLRMDATPSPIGFDPSIQLLHVEDAARALAFAASAELAGVYNVASAGLIHWRAAIARSGRRPALALPIGRTPFAAILERFGVPHIPAALSDHLRYGHVLDIQKIQRAGWKPLHDQASCLSSLC